MKLLALCSIITFLLIPAFAQQVGNIPGPANFKRLKSGSGSFPYWLQHLKLKKDHTVYLYNGQKKRNLQAQYAVLEISIGKKDLLQCADAVIRLYAEWQYANKQYAKIMFLTADDTPMDYASWRKGYRFVPQGEKLKKVKSKGVSDQRADFDDYLQTVFTYAGTLSLSKQLKRVSSADDILPGDVFLQGGSPGHTVIVMDLAISNAGERRFLLAQSYMPAQNIHILRNPRSLSPWYSNKFRGELVTPEWVFKAGTWYR
ncbi:DUF4846 domain-containing protein [Pedobacter sp. N36a]|uniref:DUF4846 domain-containing protein n=1 Tax=Pedobacter sp. N36a TaxID=2767996 RepID=UPI001656D10F|nr:DUF4846 domain-containing protein [Pedobacter sp. N36a]MBC8986821.1 DUF4846 domain-containing protein [Pedobacter sp. N36a]